MAFNSILSPITTTLEAVGDVVSSISKTTKILDDMIENNLEARKASKDDRLAAVIASHKVEAMKDIEAYAKASAKFQERTGTTYADVVKELLG